MINILIILYTNSLTNFKILYNGNIILYININL